MNKLRAKLEGGTALCGMHVTLADSCICDIIGPLGYDFIWVDTEHSHISLEDVLIHMMAANQHQTQVVVRVPRMDYTFTKKVLEMGPAGIVFPGITSADEADEAMAYTLYPPEGTRGFGPLRAVGYGTNSANEYVHEGHREMCRFIQLEHVAAIEALPEILRNPWIDGYILGPNDLAASIGRLGDSFHPEAVSLVRRAAALLREHGKPLGVSLGDTDPKLIRFYCELGISILSVGADYGHLLHGAERTIGQARAILGEKERNENGN